VILSAAVQACRVRRSWLEWGAAQVAQVLASRPHRPHRIPFRVDLPACTYGHLAQALGLICGQDRHHSDVYNYNIQIVFPERKIIGHRSDVTDLYMKSRVPNSDLRMMAEDEVDFFPGCRTLYLQLGVIEAQEVLGPADFETGTWRDLNDRMIAALAKGYALMTFINEFFVPETIRYLRTNHRHRIMVVGNDRSHYHVVAYSRRGVFEGFRVPFCLFLQGLLSRGNRRHGDPCSRFVRGLRFAEGRPHRLDCRLMALQMSDFLYSRNRMPEFLPRQVYATPVYPVRFGLQACASLQPYLEQLFADGQTIDPRVFRLFTEHANLMRERMTAVVEGHNGKLPGALHGALQRWCRLARDCHHLAISYNGDADNRAGTRKALMRAVGQFNEFVSSCLADCRDTVLQCT
jgi:hypothetical protein